MTQQARKPTRSRPVLDRAIVLAEARAMVIESGHEALSLRPLAGRLGVTAAALYAYVDDKLELLHALALAEYNRLADAYEAFESTGPIDLLHQISRLYVRNAEENPELFRVMFLFPPHQNADEDVDAEFVGAMRSYGIARNAVADAMAAGHIRQGDIELVSQSIWSAVHGVAVFMMTREDLDAGFQGTMLDTVFNNLIAGLALPRAD